MGFSRVLARAIEDGLVAAALVDRDGDTIDLAGAITVEETMPLVAMVMYRLKSADLAARLFTGEILSLTLDDRAVAVAVAKRQLFVVAIVEAATESTLAVVRDLCDVVENMLADSHGEMTGPPPWSGGGGGSGSGPAELP